MTIRYTNGDTFEAVLLSRTDSSMRLALRGADDIVELNRIHGAWVTNDCEPVQVAFAWQRQEAQTVATEEECICPPELAARLLHLLHAGDDAETDQGAASLLQVETMAAAAYLV